VNPHESLPYSNVSVPTLSIEVPNAADRGLGMAIPTGKVKATYKHHLLATSPDHIFSLSVRGFGPTEVLFVPLRPQLAHEHLVTVQKSRTNYRLSESVLSENFVVTIRNVQSLEPLHVVMEDCAFRHTNWSIRRSTHPHVRNGTHYFYFVINPLPYNTKVEINYVIEYTLPPSEVLSSPRGEDGRSGEEREGQSKKKGGQRFLSSLLHT
jgi:hypothetical protein